MGAGQQTDGHSPVVAIQGEGTLRGGRGAALEVVDAALVDDDKAKGPWGQCSSRGQPQSHQSAPLWGEPQRPCTMWDQTRDCRGV